MQLLKKIIDFYIFSNIHVAMSGFSLTKITLLGFGISNNSIPFFVGFSIIVSYNFIRYYEITENRLIWFKDWFFKNIKKIMIVYLLSIAGIGYILFFTNFYLKSLIVLLPFVFMTFFYAIPLFKIGKTEFSFRNFPAIKIFSIAIAWAGISVIFPLYEAKYQLTSEIYLEFIQRILYLLALTIPFDIRDVDDDSTSLKTLPQMLGITNVKILGIWLLLGFVLLENLKVNFTYSNLLIAFLVGIITGLFLWFSKPKSTRYYISFWVESIPIIWLGLILLFSSQLI
jgi:hypothetical protein